VPESQFTQALTQLEARLDARLAKIETKQDQTNEILETWQAFKTGGRIITNFAKFTTAILAVILFIKVGLVSLLEGHK